MKIILKTLIKTILLSIFFVFITVDIIQRYKHFREVEKFDQIKNVLMKGNIYE